MMRFEVGQNIKVVEPTDELRKWARDNLILRNPEYYKLQAMGKWTGNTSETITLFEQDAGCLWLPFGCFAELCRMFPDANLFANLITADVFPVSIDYQSRVNLYDYQEDAVQTMLKQKNGVIIMPCGSGKTQTGLEAIARIGQRALWLTHTGDLLRQSKRRAETVFGIDPKTFGEITGGRINIGSSITFATVQTMCGIDLPKYSNEWNIVVVDECFPAGTKIMTPNGEKELQFLRNGDIITSYNRTTGAIENKKVTHTFKLKPKSMVKVRLSDESEIVSTSNHPFYVKNKGWIPAENLGGDDYVMRLVWSRNRLDYSFKDKLPQKHKTRLGILFKRMRHKRWARKGCMDRRKKKNLCRLYETNERKISRSNCRTYENRQSDETAGSQRKSIEATERNRPSSKNQMRKRNRTDGATTKSYACPCRKMRGICRISDTDKKRTRQWISDLLQSRYSNSRRNACNRSRRQFSLHDRAAGTRQEKSRFFEWVRVDCIEVQERTSDGTFGGLCPDGYVYNIEVADNNNYFADGVLVHNCQHCAGSPTKVTQFYKVVSNLCARYKFGLTATLSRSDGLERAVTALLGPVIHECDRECVADTTVPIKVEWIDTGYTPDLDEVTQGDGTLDYHKMVEALCENKKRFDVVFDKITDLDGPAIVLANRVEYLKEMCFAYTDGEYGKAVCISGAGQSKKAKEQRKRALEQLNNKEIDCVFCTYLLAAEGLDVPNLRYVIFATPEQNERVVIQAVGRVSRKADGKKYGTVIDFVDEFGMYKKWWKKRLSIYKKIECDIIE